MRRRGARQNAAAEEVGYQRLGLDKAFQKHKNIQKRQKHSKVHLFSVAAECTSSRIPRPGEDQRSAETAETAAAKGLGHTLQETRCTCAVTSQLNPEKIRGIF